ncbi:CFAP221 [Blepharisma stoltei]|uniref:Primary ciliary dyskinesia protein 1 n=1 Tax=Blepharisma stoltei TaxID=1481888 RepID=A0AAU9JGT1_9CILI|nr:unnamed protein product [Blepharisma stoltei]
MEPLVIQEQIIEKESTKLVSSLEKKNYDMIGSNGVFEVKPSVLTFAGYEIKKCQTKKLLIKNISGTPQRMSILPTNTPFFKPKYNKRGQLAPGMSEVVYIQFTPPEWRYYYDCIRFLSPGGNLNIPIHSYPVMNKKERYLPALLDMGKCNIGETITKKIDLESTVPVAFEYELRFVEENNDFRIDPLSGDVPGQDKAEITITYEPKAASTSTCEVELRLSEFDYRPITMKLIASGMHKQMETPMMSRIDSSPIINRTLLKGNKETSFERAPKKLPEIVPKPSKTLTKFAQMLVKPKLIDRVIYEQQFNTEYRKLEEGDREKEFKIYQCIGNPHPSEELIKEIIDLRAEKDYNKNEEMRNKDCMRNAHQVDQDKPINDVSFTPLKKPTWDPYQNDEFSLRQLPLHRLVRAANKVMVQLRVSKRIEMIKKVLTEHKVNNREDAKKFVAWDWKRADLIGIGNKDFIPFEFTISQDEIKKYEFPTEYEEHLDEFKQKIDIEPLSAFESIQPLKLIETQDFLIAGYNDFLPPPVSHYIPIEKEREFRAGAEEEYSICLERGEFRDDPVLSVPNSCLKPMVIDAVGLVRPHPTLRTYLTLSALTETSPEFSLLPKEFPRDYPEEYPGFTQPSLSFLAQKWRPKYNYSSPQLPEKLKGMRPAEILSDSDSESENTFAMDVPVLDQYLASFENDDEALKGEKVNAKEIAMKTLCEEITKGRQKDSAWLPTQLVAANKQISDPDHKVSIFN